MNRGRIASRLALRRIAARLRSAIRAYAVRQRDEHAASIDPTHTWKGRS